MEVNIYICMKSYKEWKQENINEFFGMFRPKALPAGGEVENLLVKAKNEKKNEQKAFCPFCRDRSAIITYDDAYYPKPSIEYWHCTKCNREWHVKDAEIPGPHDKGYGGIFLPKDKVAHMSAPLKQMETLYLSGLVSDEVYYENKQQTFPFIEDQKDSSDIKNKIFAAIDNWAKSVLDSLQQPSSEKPMGLWNRFKSGVTNLFYGRNNEKNPNYWQNRYGDLGAQKESYLSIKQYNKLKDIVESFEKEILILSEADGNWFDIKNRLPNPPKFDNTKIADMIRKMSDELKKNISNIIDGKDKNPTPAAPDPLTSPVEETPPAEDIKKN